MPFRTQVSVWPNPVDETLYIEYPEFRSGEVIRVTLYDLQGRMVIETDQYPEETRINLNTRMLKPGYYVGTCTQANCFSFSFRIVKKP